MSKLFASLILLVCVNAFCDSAPVRTTIDFVRILDENQAEALYYYQNNWKVLREKALQEGYIHSFRLLQTKADDDAPFHLMLITSYQNETQFANRELNFRKLIEQQGGVKLLNKKTPNQFRRVLFSKEGATSL